MESFTEGNSIVDSEQTHFNPFPGLRPFTTEESHLFFGREGQSQEVLKFLADNRFVALLGTSGSGKSSLMYCGVIPILQGGFITQAGADWQVITCRPGQNPIRNLGNALTDHISKDSSQDELQKEFIYSTLTASSVGLIEALNYVPRKENENILLLVDQFEELFRFRRIKDSVEATNEVLSYIKLLIEVLNKPNYPVYVVITMRSDFIGECAQFQELTQFINDSHYLIPQMTRDNFREAIEGPVAVGGGKITPFLVQQLLNDIGDNPDQLPILQHALMRTWEAWVKAGRADVPIDIKDYENIGRLTKALSEHANEAYNELTQHEKDICQSLFKTLTEKAGDNRGVRRPTSVAEIAEIAIASNVDVIAVIEHFRKAGRSFLAPGSKIHLNSDSVIDISHESLMRIWDKLIIWVSEEYEAVQMYKRLSDSSKKYQLGETALWRPPDLQLALNWRDKQKPTLTWAQRHNPAFERTMVYLESSQKEYQLEEENKIRQQKRALRRTRMFAVVLGSASIISLYFMINSVVQKNEADKAKIEAVESQELAEKQKELAETQKVLADDAKTEAQKSETAAIQQKELADKERLKAQRSAKEALRQKEIANKKSIEASEQRVIAEQSAEEANRQAKIAEQARLDAQKLRMLSISQSMAVKSEQIDIDTTLKALVAYQAFEFNRDYGGNAFNPDVYNGLYFAQKSLYGNQETDYVGHTDRIRGIVIPSAGDSFYSTGSGGKVFKWNKFDNIDTLSYYNTENTNRFMALSTNGENMFIGTSSGDVLLFDLTQDTAVVQTVFSHESAVATGLFLNSKELLTISSGGVWTLSNIETNKSKELQDELPIKKIIANNNDLWAISKEGLVVQVLELDPFNSVSYVAEFSEDGKSAELIEITDETIIEGKHISVLNALAISENGSYMTLADISGNVMVWDFSTKQFITRLTGHTARINQVEFDETETYMASASNDGKVIVWNTSDFNLPPLLFTDNEEWAMTLEFFDGGNALYVGYADGKLRRWSTSIVPLAENVKKKINRNFNIEEWQQFIAKDIEYARTIDSLPGLETQNIKQL